MREIRKIVLVKIILFPIFRKDKFEEMTKEGCGRVQVLEMTNLIHTFTLECGFH